MYVRSRELPPQRSAEKSLYWWIEQNCFLRSGKGVRKVERYVPPQKPQRSTEKRFLFAGSEQNCVLRGR